MKSILCKLICMLAGGILIGFNVRNLDDGIHIMLYVIGLALIGLSLSGIGKQMGGGNEKPQETTAPILENGAGISGDESIEGISYPRQNGTGRVQPAV